MSKTSLHFNDLLPLLSSLPHLSTLLLAYNAMKESLLSVNATKECLSDDAKKTSLSTDNVTITTDNVTVTTDNASITPNNVPQPPHTTNETPLSPNNTTETPSSPIPLRSLDLTGNDFADWSSLAALNTFPSLSSLCLESNPLALPAVAVSFPRVTSLNIAATSVDSLATLRRVLACFPALTDLELRRTPWYAATEDARGTVIALCPSLTQLNGATVTAEERREEEVAFVRREMQRLLAQRKLSLEQLMQQSQPLAGHPDLEVGERGLREE